MNIDIDAEISKAIWVANSLFNRGKVSGSSANLSFLYEDCIYITGSGTCFGTLKKEDFAIVDLEGNVQNFKKPSKELPLHKIFYKKNKSIRAIVHTHSFYSVLISCLVNEDSKEIIPKYTPYLEMKVGSVGLIPYAPPGSLKLFDLFEKRAGAEKGYFLKNHGLIVGGKDIMDAFYNTEELEESAKISWFLKDTNASIILTE